MCNKLIVVCLTLVVAGFCTPASAESAVSLYHPLKVDIVYGPDNQQPKDGWLPWAFPMNWSGPIIQTFVIAPFLPWPFPDGILEVYRKNQGANSNAGVARNRSGGWAGVLGTGDFSPTTEGFGMNYVKLTLTQLEPDTTYKFSLWSFEQGPIWSASSSNPNSKYACWSTANPKDWLDNNYNFVPGEPPNGGYGPTIGSADSNMPPGLAALVAEHGGRASVMAPAGDNSNYIGGTDYRVSFYATSDSEGIISVYGWIDPTDWAGSMHLPLNGFMVIPEPVTIALLGLGGLALLRKRRA